MRYNKLWYDILEEKTKTDGQERKDPMNIDSVTYSTAAVQTGYVRNTDAETETAKAPERQATPKTDSFSYSAPENAESRAALVSQLKAELEQNQTRFMNTVKDMLTQQGIHVSGDGIWKTLASGNFSVDAATKAEAQKNISDDGYWGVEQTSDRIVKYASALSGGDPDMLDKMIQAFEKGYEAAEKAWGGSLPGISQKTREAVHKKFDELKKKNAQEV